ncbi:hypothetical protein GWK47_005210 [Chionoecetes opilio]|uniref:Uncharacterized protein n=1 Tax=Chionoecetes opilio TaxID=41210 RepID=A0A8J5CL11_CHIOP|nr:hypothetical protein GWK47_005210 [Chionoecetes opilio]
MEKKPQHREKLEGKELYVTCEQLCFKITKEQWEKAPSLSQVKKSRHTAFPFSMHFMQQNLGTSLSSSLQRIQTSLVLCLGMCHKIPSTCFPEVRERRTGQDSWISPQMSRTLGGSVCDSLILGCMPLQAVIPSVHSLAGEDDDTKQVKMDKTTRMLFPRTWALMGSVS